MMRDLIKITITDEQRDYLLENYKNTPRKDLAEQMGITKAKLDANMIRLDLTAKSNSKKRMREVRTEGIFFVDEYKNWLLGTTYDLYRQ